MYNINIKRAVLVSSVAWLVLSAALSQQAFANENQRKGTWTVSARVGPMNASSDLATEGVPNIGPVGFTPDGFIPNTAIDLEADVAITFHPNYFITEHIAIDMVIGLPTKFNIYSQGLESLGVTDLTEVKLATPTLSLSYFPAPASSKIQPSISAGIGKIVQTSGGDATPGILAALGPDTDVDLNFDGIALSAQFGIDYRFSEKWSLGVHGISWWDSVNIVVTPSAQIPLGPGITAPLGQFELDLDAHVWAVQTALTYHF